jgi:hypothetical protein
MSRGSQQIFATQQGAPTCCGEKTKKIDILQIHPIEKN